VGVGAHPFLIGASRPEMSRLVSRRIGGRASIAAMPYDEVLADRIRVLLPSGVALTEQRMFGGLAFLVGGNMAIAASHEGGVLVRVDPDEGERLVATTSARPMEMRGRSMTGWLRVDADDFRTSPQLKRWVEVGVAYARSLPAKTPKTPKTPKKR
jgi:TfoX/Sxy family transcriptional regulator of competence genes